MSNELIIYNDKIRKQDNLLISYLYSGLETGKKSYVDDFIFCITELYRIPLFTCMLNAVITKIKHKEAEFKLMPLRSWDRVLGHCATATKEIKAQESVFNKGLFTKHHTIVIRSITPTYSEKNRQQVINNNLKSDIHPYYYEYEPLRQICLQILMEDDELKYGRAENKIYGVLFDAAWLWEEYLNTLISEIDSSFIHTRNKEGVGMICMLKNKDNKPKYWQAYPDFYSEVLGIVMDAKYKHAKEVKDIARDDRMQIISYMHILGLKKGVFLHPADNKHAGNISYGKLNIPDKNTDEYVYQYCFKIPQGEINCMQDFIDKITVSENEFIEYWKSILKNNNETVKC